jgi:hypothetical protein
VGCRDTPDHPRWLPANSLLRSRTAEAGKMETSRDDRRLSRRVAVCAFMAVGRVLGNADEKLFRRQLAQLRRVKSALADLSPLLNESISISIALGRVDSEAVALSGSINAVTDATLPRPRRMSGRPARPEYEELMKLAEERRVVSGCSRRDALLWVADQVCMSWELVTWESRRHLRISPAATNDEAVARRELSRLMGYPMPIRSMQEVDLPPYEVLYPVLTTAQLRELWGGALKLTLDIDSVDPRTHRCNRRTHPHCRPTTTRAA